MKVSLGKGGGKNKPPKKKEKKSREERLKDAYERAKRGAGGTDFYRFANGTTRMIVLPAIDDDDLFFAEGGQHYKATADGKPVGCPNATLNKSCPICEVMDEAYAVDKEHKLLKNHRLNRRYYYNVLILRKDEEPQPYLISIGNKAHLQILDLEQDTEEYGDISNIESALIVRVKRSGEKWNEVEYTVTPGNKRVDLTEEYPEQYEEWLEKRKDLNELVAGFVPERDVLESIAERMSEDI